MTTITPPQSVGIARPLGALEQFFSLIDQHRSVHFAMAAHIEGRTTVPAWRMALDTLQERHPLLSVGIERNNGDAPYFRTVMNRPIPLRIAEHSDLAGWRLEIAKELVTPFHPQQAPLVRAVLLHGTDESMLILTAHHSIADGFSLTYAVRDMIRALSGEVLEPLPPTPPQEVLVQALQEFPNGTQSLGESEPPQTGGPVTFRVLDGSLPSIEALRLSSELTDRLIQFSRQEKTTVHGALCAGLVLAGREVSKDWSNAPVRIMSPFNLRKQIGIGEDCGVFIWAGIVPIESRAPAAFWDIARTAKSSLTAMQSPHRVAFEMAGLGKTLEAGVDVQTASQIHAQGFPCELLLTNLGNLSYKFTYGNLKLQALWGPAVFTGFQGEQTVGAATMNGSLCLLHSSFTPLASLLQRTERILHSACKK